MNAGRTTTVHLFEFSMSRYLVVTYLLGDSEQFFKLFLLDWGHLNMHATSCEITQALSQPNPNNYFFCTLKADCVFVSFITGSRVT